MMVFGSTISILLWHELAQNAILPLSDHAKQNESKQTALNQLQISRITAGIGGITVRVWECVC